MRIFYNKYNDILSTQEFPKTLEIVDHLNGFDSKFDNQILNHVNAVAKPNTTLISYYVFNEEVKQRYNNLNFKLSQNQTNELYQLLINHNIHPDINYKNFLCSFNGSSHVGRKLLVSILKKFGYFNPEYCSKNFSYPTDMLFGHVHDFVGDQDRFYNKFFVENNSEEFFNTIYSFGHNRYEHNKNIYTLESKLTSSFIHLVSETMATSYHPFVSEKFLYSVVTRGLFLAYAQPGWHAHVEEHYGFRRYTKLFDYRFDTIENPVSRLVELITMISKFSHLSPAEWQDFYQIEQETIEFN